MSISIRKDPNKINSVAGTFEKYIAAGKTPEYISEALRNKDYSDAEIQEGYELYLKSKNSNTTSLVLIGVIALAIGILAWKYYQANFNKPEPVQVAQNTPVVETRPPPTPTEIPVISTFDEQNVNDPQMLFDVVMKSLKDEYCEEKACEPTAEEVSFVTQNLLLTRQGQIEKAQSLWEKAKRRRVVMTDPEEIKKADEEIAKLKAEFDKALSHANPEKAKKEAAESLQNRKFRKMIYDDYFGLVVRRPFGPDPIGAYKKAAQVYKEAGRLQFFNPQFEAQFWKLFDPKPTDRLMQQDSYNF